MAAGRLVDAAARRLGPPLDAALPRALAAAGLSEDAVVAIPRVALRLRLDGEVDTADLSGAWAEALAEAIVAACPGARHDAQAATADDGRAVFATPWHAEAALLRAAARGEPAPWWAAAAELDVARPGAALRLLRRWIARDPARAAAEMAALLAAAPRIAALLSGRDSTLLAEAFLAALRAALGDTAMVRMPDPVGTAVPAIAHVLGALPGWLRNALAPLPGPLRPPWIAAAILAHAPSWASTLPDLVASLAALPEEDWRAAAGGQTATPAAPVSVPGPARPVAAAPRVNQSEPPPSGMPRRAQDIVAGGLLLLLRPLATLAPEWLAAPGTLPSRLIALGLLAMQRLAAPLPPASRRSLLERDRPLLAVFAGSPVPDAPLDDIPLTDLAAEALLARLLAAAPAGIAHAPAALRRIYGRDPFADDPATDLLCRLLLRPGRLVWDDSAAEVAWPLDAADVALRRAGWDQNPGWLPWIGRRVTFHFGTAP